ncbi:hypothetical protein LXA47_08570 [Massilia sp. P8910]|uniref:hypothetical protein n=1 Tax=Massilia antarctica TaxID=2765360 RepID=UPI001E4AD233|nr:hypothetical protein [Massilia antarctica]MCE3603659.1 hypothetical protein [Massilia antarctica]
MIDRIGELHLHYRVSQDRSLASAVSASVDRAVRSGLGEALDARIAALLGDQRAVIVVREIRSSVALGPADWSLDSRVVECISRAAADALLTMLSGNPAPDSVMRFDDQAAFTGAFIVALLEGSAWERWYYGAFHRYRRADPAATLRALLEECGDDITALFGWLARHGHLAALLTLVTPRDARRLLGAARPAAPGHADGSAVLADAARRLLTLLAPPPVTLAELDQRIAQFLAARPLAPDWTSASSLSVWVMQLLRFALRLPDGALPAPAPGAQEALRALLAGPLDWLDTRWLEAQLFGAAAGPPAVPAAVPAPRRQLLTPRQERVLGMLARSLADGELHLAAADGEDDIVVRLIAAAAAAAAGADGPLERGIIAVIERAARACLAAKGNSPDGPASHAGHTPPLPQAAREIEALRAAGPSALALLEALLGARGPGSEADQASATAGVFLLTRAVSDLRLPALARQAGVALAPLLAALAAQWSGSDLPAGLATALWCGAGPADPADLDDAGAALDALNHALLELLVVRRVMDAATAEDVIAADAASLDHALACAPHTGRRLAATACMLLRGWAHWLPGMAGSDPLFLLQRSVRRAGSVALSGERILVGLDPAPLDIVLRMAGYLAPIEPVDWLGGRSLVFTLRQRASEPTP